MGGEIGEVLKQELSVSNLILFLCFYLMEFIMNQETAFFSAGATTFSVLSAQY